MRVALRVDGQGLGTQRRALEVPVVLMRHAGEVVTREAPQEAVWNGRISVDNVIDSALTKLRGAPEEHNARLICTQPRVGLRLIGPVRRVAVGRHVCSDLAREEGLPVPRQEVWRARHAKTQERRVYRFSADGEGWPRSRGIGPAETAGRCKAPASSLPGSSHRGAPHARASSRTRAARIAKCMEQMRHSRRPFTTVSVARLSASRHWTSVRHQRYGRYCRSVARRFPERSSR